MKDGSALNSSTKLVVIMSLLVIYQPNSINNANANDNV